MDTKKSSYSPSTRLKTGAAVLAAAQVVDTKRVKARLNAFAEAHRTYSDAQRKVDEAEAQMQAEQTRLAQIDADQDDAVEALARSLVTYGQPRGNPFAIFNADAPGTIKTLAFADEAKAIHALVTAVQRNKAMSQATLDAAQSAEQAAQKLEAALAPLETLRSTLFEARQQRDVIAQTWDKTLAALRRSARAAADDGAPGLYSALFGRPARSTKKAKPATVPPTTPPAPPNAPVA